jgi:5-methylcytosine-specific restriction endonuclease McrA
MEQFRHTLNLPHRVRSEKSKALSGGRWTKMRNQHLAMHPMCARCGALGEEVHHVTPRALRPDLTFVWSNLLTVCKLCHLAIHSADQAKR